MFNIRRYTRIRKWHYMAAGATALTGVIGGLLATHYYGNRESSISKAGNTRHTTYDTTSPADLSSWTKEELYEEAQKRDLEGRSTMTKDELVEALQAA